MNKFEYEIELAKQSIKVLKLEVVKAQAKVRIAKDRLKQAIEAKELHETHYK